MTDSIPHDSLTHADLKFASATDYEMALLDADDALSVQLGEAIKTLDGDLCNDILDEKIAIENKFQASRERTWFAWMEEQFPDAMAPYAGRRPAA